MTAPLDCTRCAGRCVFRTSVINGAGGKGGICLVGQNPNFYGDRDNQVFGGQDGALLRLLAEQSGIPLKIIFRTNAVRCFGAAKPKKDEVTNCRDYLINEILSVQPRVIITLGDTALQSLYGMGKGKNEFVADFARWEEDCLNLVSLFNLELEIWNQDRKAYGKKPLKPKLPPRPKAPKSEVVTISSVVGHTLVQPDTGLPLIPSYHPAFLMGGKWAYCLLVIEHFKKAYRIYEGIQ